MIAKNYFKDIILLGVIGIAAVTAVVYGLSSVTSPSEQKAKNFDATRSEDLLTIQQAISVYYNNNTKLPENLDELSFEDTYYYSEKLKDNKPIFDPETNQKYEYSITDNAAYKLCASFSTDTGEQKKPNNESKLNLTILNDIDADYTKHKKGHACFESNVDTYSNLYNQEPIPTMVCAGTQCNEDTINTQDPTYPSSNPASPTTQPTPSGSSSN